MTGLDQAGAGMPAPRIASEGASSLSPPNLPHFGQHLLQQAIFNFYDSRHFLSARHDLPFPTTRTRARRSSWNTILLSDEQILPVTLSP